MQVKMKDIYGTTIVIQESRSGYFRIDLSGEWFPEKIDPVSGKNLPNCISLNEDKARVLLSALNEYFENER
jgi:hypothetical protein